MMYFQSWTRLNSHDDDLMSKFGISLINSPESCFGDFLSFFFFFFCAAFFLITDQSLFLLNVGSQSVGRPLKGGSLYIGQEHKCVQLFQRKLFSIRKGNTCCHPAAHLHTSIIIMTLIHILWKGEVFCCSFVWHVKGKLISIFFVYYLFTCSTSLNFLYNYKL